MSVALRWAPMGHFFMSPGRHFPLAITRAGANLENVNSGLVIIKNEMEAIALVSAGHQARSLSTSGAFCMPFEKKRGPSTWPRHNKVLFPPQAPEEKRRPAYVCHHKENIKYSPWKMWYIAAFIRGMSVDEALRQLDYIPKKGASYVKQTLLEARELALNEHHVEFRSNLWVAESFCGKGVVVRGIRRHARKRIGLVEYFHCHYFVRLEEGSPPKHYYQPEPDGPTLLQRWIDERRDQRVFRSY